MKFLKTFFIFLFAVFVICESAKEQQKSKGKKIICYFTNWAWYRSGIGKYTPSDIDPHLCTHIVYGFATLDPNTLTIRIHDRWADIDNKFYKRVTALRKKGIKVTIAIGGWTDSGNKYSKLIKSLAARKKFIQNVMKFIKKYNFQGLDLDLEYPGCWQGACHEKSKDKRRFASFVKELSNAFKPKGYLLSAAVSPSKKVINIAYDIPTMSKYLDWIGMMAYDYHGSFDKTTGHNAPLYHYPGDKYKYFNVDYTVNYWIKKGAEKRKLIVGIPTYGRSFTLADPSKNGMNAPVTGGGKPGPITKDAGSLAYYEICKKLKQGWHVKNDKKNRIGPYAYHGNQWVGYDDTSMIHIKAKYIRKKDLGGAMVWALDLDDFRGKCGHGKYPLLKALKAGLRK